MARFPGLRFCPRCGDRMASAWIQLPSRGEQAAQRRQHWQHGVSAPQLLLDQSSEGRPACGVRGPTLQADLLSGCLRPAANSRLERQGPGPWGSVRRTSRRQDQGLLTQSPGRPLRGKTSPMEPRAHCCVLRAGPAAAGHGVTQAKALSLQLLPADDAAPMTARGHGSRRLPITMPTDGPTVMEIRRRAALRRQFAKRCHLELGLAQTLRRSWRRATTSEFARRLEFLAAKLVCLGPSRRQQPLV